MNELGRIAPIEKPDRRLSPSSAYDLASDPALLDDLIHEATAVRDSGHGNIITYSRNVFVPLTHLCRDVCHYCTFAHQPSTIKSPYMSRSEVLEVARNAAAMGCTEVLFTLGDKPEQRYTAARETLADLGHETTISYLAEIAGLVHQETGLLAHVNPGVIDEAEIKLLRQVSASQGLMLESTAERLCERGGPHFGSPDKIPARRLETLRLAGVNKVPTTSGILIGIGETRHERIDALLALRDLHDRYGHLQEIIIQNFKPKPATQMADHREPAFEDLLWTIAMARLLFGPDMNIQAPPNLLAEDRSKVIAAGINDWGGVSPLTPDFVNPEAPWPQIAELAHQTARSGKLLCERLAVYPKYVANAEAWLDEGVVGAVLRHSDATGLAREENWFAGMGGDVPVRAPVETAENTRPKSENSIDLALKRAATEEPLSLKDTVSLLNARGTDVERVCEAADDLRRRVCGDDITYVINRNINYTNICSFRCAFCAFSKSSTKNDLRDKPYVRESDEVVSMAADAIARGATEVCMQGGIHPSYTGDTYLGHTRAVHDAFPELHIHGFSPLEIWHGAQTLEISIADFLSRMKAAGLSSLPGTAAEILDDEIRDVICPDKLNTKLWLEILETAHGLGIPTTATIMFGHVEKPIHVARHLLHIRNLQIRTGGFTEFVPLPFVHMEAPIALKNRARRGPTYREAILMHAVARLTLHPHISNIQTSWVKMGLEGAKACLKAGCNDLGGVLMSESISRAAGSAHGQEFRVDEMHDLIHSIARQPRQRRTDYGSLSR
ncbi:MAG: 5-amino-6-(D-ribitylamino)uracil--L-tyrosine 4-hydroxyphenyl transferase CofH [Rhodospirillaceae bacterium]|nr:5-amino-6-(D-ribitylamino)uracil--L-tyrosine 4-hydroxyphenyl transferase CofH [Rhodospirillaceae bacterium]